MTPYLTRHLINATIPGRSSTAEGIGYALGVSFMFFFTTLVSNLNIYYATLVGAQARTVLTHAIYSKNLKLSGKARLEYTNGKITNMLSTDCHRIDFGLGWFHYAWTFPISIGIGVAIVVINIGAPGLVGFAILFSSLIGVVYIGKVIISQRKSVTVITDNRVSIMREILHSMKIIKFYSWEEAYLEKINQIRKKELKKVNYLNLIQNMLSAIFASVPTLAGLVSFIVLSKTGGELNPATVFSSLSVFNIIRAPLLILPLSLMTTNDAFQALVRIQGFLSAPEMVQYVQRGPTLTGDSVILTNASFIWEVEDAEKETDGAAAENQEEDLELTREYSKRANHAPVAVVEPIIPDDTESLSEKNQKVEVNTTTQEAESANPTHTRFPGLTNLDLNIKDGEFVIITGAIGSGKSSLLSAIAGTMVKTTGTVEVSGNVSYCGQPWVQNTTLQNNITFGNEFDQDWYNTVVSTCSLIRDFEILPAGDQTEVGERGITLSGGQKARISLARAVYRDSDIILLDDVLSAVDAHVGKSIMDNCIRGVLQKKTRILVTHQISMIPFADRVIFLDGKGNATAGTAAHLRSTIPAFDELMKLSDNSAEEEESEIKEDKDEKDDEEKEGEDAEKEKKEKVSGALVEEEEKAVHGVAPEVYLTFVDHGPSFLKWIVLPSFILLVALATFAQIFTNTWLSFWTGHKFDRTDSFYIGIFVLIALMATVFLFAYYTGMALVVLKTSKSLHLKAVQQILHSPMSFFDTQPIGRILNRFAHDTDVLDNEIGQQARFFVTSIANVFGVFVLIIIFLPYFAIALAGLTVLFLASSSYYRASARELKRLDSLGRSKVLTHFTETLTGVSTIVAYGEQEQFLRKSEKSLNRMNAAYLLTLVNQRWLAIRLDMIGTALMIVVTVLCVTHQFRVSPSTVGLIVSSLLSVVSITSTIVREFATVENEMNSVERIHHYAKNLDQEAPFHIAATAPPPEWPAHGAIEFKDVTMSYQPSLPPVLREVNFTVKPGEKIGICGRTGAGKSSIMTALYRMVELTSGQINIDGIDVATLGMHELRSKLSIIPQDPVLFQGTIRNNIDPFGVCSDLELWNALRQAWLLDPSEYDIVSKGGAKLTEKPAEGSSSSANSSSGNGESSMKFHLDQTVDDDGSNFSLGERQLLALARALVRNTKVLILDEATSSVDFATDNKIQSTIATSFAHCTILCIAHRLKTIINYDRILVLDAGQIVEFDTPENLFRMEAGVFRSMCDKSRITIEDFPVQN